MEVLGISMKEMVKAFVLVSALALTATGYLVGNDPLAKWAQTLLASAITWYTVDMASGRGM